VTLPHATPDLIEGKPLVKLHLRISVGEFFGLVHLKPIAPNHNREVVELARAPQDLEGATKGGEVAREPKIPGIVNDKPSALGRKLSRSCSGFAWLGA
jgi:hypothetical protein